MKKVLSFLLSMVMLISVFSGFGVKAFAATSGTTGDLSFSLNTDTGVLTISGSGRSGEYANALFQRAPWYNDRASIKSVVVEDGVIALGAYLFNNCTNMTSITIADSVDTIGEGCFRACKALTNITLPSGAWWCWKEAFIDCTALKWAILPGGNSSYSGELPEGLFKNCTALEEVYVGAGHTSIGADAFNGCTALRGIIWDSGEITAVGSNGLSSVPSSCTFVDDSESLSSWAASNGYAYSPLSDTCSSNTYTSKNLTYSFDTSSMKLSFTGSGDMDSKPWSVYHYLIKSVDFSATDGKYSIGTEHFQGSENIESIDFGSRLYAIGWGAFAENYSLKKLLFPATLEAIWNWSFANCTSLETIEFTSGGTSDLHIYSNAFNNCTGTTYWINLPENTRYIDAEAFNCTNFNYVTIASPTVTMGTNAFGNGEGGYARFFGIKDSGVYDWVKEARASGYSWYYYCMNDNHTYTITVVSPNCTEQGYDLCECPYCDIESTKSNYTDALGHNYECIEVQGTNFIYSCSRCGKSDLSIDAVEVNNKYINAISHENDNPPYYQSNYDSRADVYRDGYVNAKDFKLIKTALNSPDLTDKATVIDETTSYQTIEGFGASAAWWAQTVGNWENIDDITSMLYSKENGIGLNIYRYNLGAGSKGDSTMYVPDEQTECFLNADGTYNWDADMGAQNALASAQKANSNLKVTLFSNSAPVSMTNNGHAYSDPVNDDGTYNINMSEENYQAFADFVATCAEHFIDEGYNVTEVSPINEPEWSWAGWYNADGSVSMNQEGCYWEYGDALNFYNNYMIPTLQSNSKLNGNVGLSVWESGQLNHSYYWNNFVNSMFSSEASVAGNNANIRAYVDSLATHSYWAGKTDRTAVAAQLTDSNYSAVQKVRCTEYCQMTNDGNTGVYDLIQQEGTTNGMGIEYGLALADIMYQDLTILNAVEWDWWVACGRGIYPDSLIYVNNNDHSDIQASKRLWCMGNYSKFIEEGAKRISVSTESAIPSTIEESAYLNPDGSIVIVYINKGDAVEYTSFDSTRYSSFETYVTDETHDLELYQSGSVEGRGVAIPAKGVTTVILQKGNIPAKTSEGKYLFTYFTGNDAADETIHFAVSDDGYNFEPLNGNQQVITQTLGKQCCRDPYIFKAQDGSYYIIATDMKSAEGWSSQSSIVLWHSTDLVNWGEETILDFKQFEGFESTVRAWAPQVIWDEKEQSYMIYLGLATSDSTTNWATYLYYVYSDDLKTIKTEPQLLYKPADNGASIDGDIIYNKATDTYYLYYKDETAATVCYVTSKNVNGPYVDATNPSKVLDNGVAVEGSLMFNITGTDTWVMYADAYNDGYFICQQTTDFKHFYPLDSEDYNISSCSPRHGSIINISDEQYNSLVSTYGK
ncbi:MAG: glycoside hydrolase [Eubacterium sp.]